MGLSEIVDRRVDATAPGRRWSLSDPQALVDRVPRCRASHRRADPPLAVLARSRAHRRDRGCSRQPREQRPLRAPRPGLSLLGLVPHRSGHLRSHELRPSGFAAGGHPGAVRVMLPNLIADFSEAGRVGEAWESELSSSPGSSPAAASIARRAHDPKPNAGRSRARRRSSATGSSSTGCRPRS